MTTTNRTVHLLLVEDDEVDVMAFQRALARQRIANPLVVARDGLEALALLRGVDRDRIPAPRIVFLDLNMPRMSGLELLAEMREDPELRSTVVFVLTTSRHDQDKARAYDHNVAGYIVKSEVGSDLIRVLDLLDAYWRVVELP